MMNNFYRYLLTAIFLPLASTANAEMDGLSLTGVTTTLATPNSVQLGYSVDSYSRTYEENPIYSLQYGRLTSWGSFSLRLNAADRYQSQDTQYEMDVYPKLWNGGWAELNLGISSGHLFPQTRQGAEVFSALGNGYEGSIGVRHLAFTNSSVTMYTGSLSKYMGDYLLTFRPYITPSNVGTSMSAGIKLTRYFADADRYVRLSASTGKSPEERTYPPFVVALRSHSLGISGQWSPKNAVFVSPSFSHERQELLFAPGEYVGIDKLSITMSRRF
ncbi:MAG: YaiO family outer membrane beta-barrel protein [Gallionella sp.]|nr:YaiO family outer membrane beta-barrel protein [Gallionella sp.]